MSATPIETAFAKYLLDDADIISKLTGRVVIGQVPQRTPFPFLHLNSFSSDHFYHLGGEAGIITTRLQFDVWDKGSGAFDRVNSIGEEIRERISGKRVQLTTDVYANTITIERDDVFEEPPSDASTEPRWRRSFDALVFHSTSI